MIVRLSKESAKAPPIGANSELGRSLRMTSMDIDVREISLLDECICSIAAIEATYVSHSPAVVTRVLNKNHLKLLFSDRSLQYCKNLLCGVDDVSIGLVRLLSTESYEGTL